MMVAVMPLPLLQLLLLLLCAPIRAAPASILHVHICTAHASKAAACTLWWRRLAPATLLLLRLLLLP
jgi:hypothetical protein